MDVEHNIEWINNILKELSNIDRETGIKLIQKCGRFCSNTNTLSIAAKKIYDSAEDKNDLDDLFRTYKERVYNTPNLYKKNGIIYLEYRECGCPMVKQGVINSFLCYCTVGYTKEIFETLFNRPVKVELLKSILNGADLCEQTIEVVE